MNRNRLARYFHKGGKKFQTPAQLVTIEIIRWDRMIISNHPADLVHVAIAPKQATYLPDIAVSTAMRAGTQVTPPAQRKLQHIVGNIHESRPITRIEL